MQATEVQVVTTDGDVSDRVKERARDKIAALERYAPGDFLHAEVRFSQPHGQNKSANSVMVQGLLDVQGRLVQARMTADQPEECLDLLESRLEKKLRRLNERLQDRRKEPAVVDEGEWRHGALPTPRPDHFPRPLEEREFVERHTFARAPSTPDEAAFDLEMLENDWLLYVDADTGADAVLRRLPDQESYGLAMASDERPESRQYAYDIHLEAEPPRMSLTDARRRLDDGDEEHVFFVDTDTERGAVVYWRYDGHYGVVRPRET